MIKHDWSTASRRSFLGVGASLGIGAANWPALAQALTRNPAGRTNGQQLPVVVHDTVVNGRLQIHSSPTSREISEAVQISLRNIITNGADNIFPMPFEISCLGQDAALRERVALETANSLLTTPSGNTPQPSICTMLTPKSGAYGYRESAFIDPLGSILYLSVALLIGRQLESIRVPPKANRVFSCRFNADASGLLDVQREYQSFQDTTFSKLTDKSSTFLITTDIADFYRHIDIMALRQTLLRKGATAWLVDAAYKLLAGWNAGSIRGLPVGPVGSQILAELYLASVDDRLLADGIDFIRFVDDYRLFAPDASTAQRWLWRLKEHLTAEHLTLNQRKTSIQLTSTSQYTTILATRRRSRLWGELPGVPPELVADNNTAPPTVNTPQETAKSRNRKKGKTPENSSKPKDSLKPCKPGASLPYEGESPCKKAQLNKADATMLEQVDRVALLSRLKKQAQAGTNISLGSFRTLIEASYRKRDYRIMGDVFYFLGSCPQCVPYLVDVLIEERQALPKALRRRAREWFADELRSDTHLSEYETLHAIRLLGTKGYEDPTTLSAYLFSRGRKLSPVITRTILAALDRRSDRHTAAALIALAKGAPILTRRAAIWYSWPHLDHTQRQTLVAEYSREVGQDIFLSALVEQT